MVLKRLKQKKEKNITLFHLKIDSFSAVKFAVDCKGGLKYMYICGYFFSFFIYSHRLLGVGICLAFLIINMVSTSVIFTEYDFHAQEVFRAVPWL